MTLQLRDVRKSYPTEEGERLPVLNIAEFQVQPGEQVALVGESGGGKTTLLNVISGILLPDRGEVVVDGVDLTRLSETARDLFRAQRIGIVFQTFNLLPGFTALENVLLGMSFSHTRVDRHLAQDLLVRVGLGHRLRHRPAQLSVGEQQRVAVARSLVKHPRLLLADEPTASVDLRHQETILTLLRDTCREQHCALLLVTHSPDVAARFDRTARMADFNRI